MKKRRRVLVACSGGPDSMALLDMYKNKYSLSVCHINYHKRKTANRDEKIVKDYCKRNNIPLYKYNYKDNKKGNFQNNARVFRYKCFAELIKTKKMEYVMVGHHLDDLLETYFLQLDRKSGVSYYGLKRKTKIMDVDIYRPLLKYSKNDLLDYCKKNNIAYGIDESNLSNQYKRNKIRHEKIEKMSDEDKRKIIKEIKYLNYVKEEENKNINKFIKNKTKFDYVQFINCPYIKDVLRKLIKEDLSDKHLAEIIKALKSKNNIELLINDKYIFKEYDYIEIIDKVEDYSYKFNKIVYKKYKYFELTNKGTSFEGVTLKKDDFPITIRNVKDGDFIMMRYGKKKINRFFIDKKIPSSLRKTWPIMINKYGTAILVPKIGCNIDHYSPNHNLFMLKLI